MTRCVLHTVILPLLIILLERRGLSVESVQQLILVSTDMRCQHFHKPYFLFLLNNQIGYNNVLSAFSFFK